MASVPLYSSLFLFADDSQCLNQIRSSQDRYNLQTDLDSISLWATRQHLKFNASKCHHLHFSPVPKTQSHKFMINDSVIPTTSEHKDLGVIFNSNLSFSSHISHVLSKAYKVLGLIRRSISTLDVSVRRALYLSLVRCHLSYCSQVWRPYLVKESKLLESLQRRATKYVLHDYISDYKSRLVALNLLPISLWLELQDILLMIKLIQDPPVNFSLSDYIVFITHILLALLLLTRFNHYHLGVSQTLTILSTSTLIE